MTRTLHGNDALRLGRQVVADVRCVKCHATDVPAGAMPELSADAPALDDVGQRYTQAWLAHWINNPRAMRCGHGNAAAVFRGGR